MPPHMVFAEGIEGLLFPLVFGCVRGGKGGGEGGRLFTEHTCSMKVQASRSVCDILRRTMTTARRRRQKDAVDSFSSCTRLFFVVITPIAYNLRKCARICGQKLWGQAMMRINRSLAQKLAWG